LCDTLDLDPDLVLEADRMSVALDESILFSGRARSGAVGAITSFWVDAEAGMVLEHGIVPPDSITFRWTPRDIGGGFQPGNHVLQLSLYLDPAAPGGGASCIDEDSVRVAIDAEGNAQVLSLPQASPLSGVYRAELVSRAEGTTFRLSASTTLVPTVAGKVVWRWRASAGTLSAEGDQARYIPDPGAAFAVVQAEAWRGERDLAVAVWCWPADARP
jgi:hypothetical protein